MKTLVTGASGNVGFPLVQHLDQAQIEVKAGSTDPIKLSALLPARVECVTFDFLEPSCFDAVLQDVDRVFLMRPPHLGNPAQLYPFIDAMVKHKIKFVVFLSLMGIEKNPIPPHAKIERYLKKSGLDYSFVRPGFFMQNISGVHALEIRQNDEIFIPAGRAKTSFVDADDVATASSLILQNIKIHSKKAYTITGPQSLDYFEVAKIITRICGRNIKYRNPGFMQYRKHMIQLRKLDKTYVDVTMALYFMTRMNTASKVHSGFYELSSHKATSFEEFVEKNRNKFIKNEN